MRSNIGSAGWDQHSAGPPRPAPTTRKSRASRRHVVLGYALSLLATGCGYHVGAPYSQEVRSVYVPMFATDTFRRGLEFQLTEAVQKQIQTRTPFRLVSEAEADTKLTGRLVSAQKTVLGQTGQSDARELQLNLLVQVTWEDLRTGKILAQEKVELPPPEAIQQSGQAEFAPEVGQSLATATQGAVDRVARNIVDMMETPW